MSTGGTTKSSAAVKSVGFGPFEFDPHTGELCKHGVGLKLRGQPLEILKMLLQRPGEVVTREELQKRLWSADTYVDFEHSLNAAMKRLRAALGDAADSPQLIETLAGRGYRFVAPVRQPAKEVPPAPQVAVSDQKPDHKLLVRRPLRIALILGIAVLAVAGMSLSAVLRNRTVAGPVRSIAVLPLANLSGDPEQDYFVEGMTDALRQQLEGISSLRVISRTSSMHYRGSSKSLPAIARELNIDAVIDGSVLRSGDRVRI